MEASTETTDNCIPNTEITCDPEHTSLTDGGVTCTSSNHLNSECSFTCNDGYMLSGSATAICNINLEDNEHGSWSNEPPVCQGNLNTCVFLLLTKLYANGKVFAAEILCTAQNAPMDGHTSCTGDVSIGSVCSFICPFTYHLVGEASSTCEEVSGNLLGIWSNDVPSCQPIVCIPQHTAPTDGNVSCDNHNLLYSVCTFTCNSGHALIGSPTTRCNFGNTTTDGVWSNDAAVCQEIICTAHGAPENGGTSCKGEVALGTVCSFSCSEGYRLLGAPSSTCGENNDAGIWNKEAPTCERLSCTPTPEAPSNGNVSCSDGDFINSTCSFTCGTGFTIIGANSTTCQTKDSTEADWNKPAPVCQRE
ncbi:E-selectin-like [Ciona intestinalis]